MLRLGFRRAPLQLAAQIKGNLPAHDLAELALAQRAVGLGERAIVRDELVVLVRQVQLVGVH